MGRGCLRHPRRPPLCVPHNLSWQNKTRCLSCFLGGGELTDDPVALRPFALRNVIIVDLQDVLQLVYITTTTARGNLSFPRHDSSRDGIGEVNTATFRHHFVFLMT